MRAVPEGFEVSDLVGALADGWGLDVATADYSAVGGGSYHWVVHDVDGTRRFVTVDDLDQKPWLGDSRDAVFAGLRRAFDTAGALHDVGLGFVVAPIRTDRGETVRRIGERHAVALFPFVDGRAGRFGHYEDAATRAAVVEMLADLHRATPAVTSSAREIGLEVPGRHRVEAALRELDETWSGGPFSERARREVAAHATDVVELLALADRLAADVASRRGEWVVTHGEPHAANVIRNGERHVLVDWDTVGLAPPERDLWMVAEDDGDEGRTYTAATGRAIDQVAMDFYRLAWDLGDLAEYLNELRSPHRRNEDTENAYLGVTRCVAGRDRWAALLG
jgi:spectinomycin phosphotransferase